MNRTLALATIALAISGLGCSDDAPPANPNPSRLWLALDGTEVEVKLSPVEPPVF